MKKEQRYTQSDFNDFYAHYLYWEKWGNDVDYKTSLKIYDEIYLMLKNEKYLDGEIHRDLIYIQKIDEKSGNTWQNAGLPEPNITMKDESGLSTYIYVVFSRDIEDYEPILTEDMKSKAHFFNVKISYPEERYYFDYFADGLFYNFKKLLNAGKYSSRLENPNCPDWNPKFKNVPPYRVKDLIKFAQE